MMNIQASCEKLLAYASQLVLPTLIPLQGRAFDWGFEYDFACERGCEEGILSLISEEMRRLIQQDIPFETLSMVPQNAYSFLEKKQPMLADRCSEYPQAVVPLCKIKDFYDICPLEIVESTRQIGHFALYEMLFLPDSCIRIRGIASTDKKAVKEQLKQIEKAKANDPVKHAEEQELLSFSGDDVIWHPKGLQCKKLLQVRPEGFEEVFCKDPLTAARSLKLANVYQDTIYESEDAEGLFQVKNALATVLYSHSTEEKVQDALISSLHFMKQIASIFKGRSQFVLLQMGKRQGLNQELKNALVKSGYAFENVRSDRCQIELHLFDARGRSWPLAKLSVLQEREPLIECYPMLSYERALALLLEEGEGFLPFWLAPEQIRLLAVDKEKSGRANEFAETLREEGFRVSVDTRAASLKEKMYKASQQKVACTVVIGAKEELEVRFLPNSLDSETMHVLQFLEKIRREERSKLESESRDSSS